MVPSVLGRGARSVLPPALLLLSSLFAGCTFFLPPECPAVALYVFAGPADEEGRWRHEPEKAPTILYWAHSPTNETGRIVVRPRLPGDGRAIWSTNEFSRSPPNLPASAFGAMSSLGPGSRSVDWPSGAYTVHLGAYVLAGHCFPFGFGDLGPGYEIAADEGGQSAQPGTGALVRLAGFYASGTMFFSNIPRLHEHPNVTRAYTVPFADEPLKFYLYNGSTPEMPRRYRDAGYQAAPPPINGILRNANTVQAEVAEFPIEERTNWPGSPDSKRAVYYLEFVKTATVPCPLPEPLCEVPPLPPLVPSANH